MKKLLVVLTVFLAMGAARAYADTVTLTFTGVGNDVPIGNYYNGGAGGNLGIAFSSNSLAIVSEEAGGSGNFSNVPPPATNTIAFFLNGVGDTMDVAAGFTTGFSFYYSATEAGSVQVWSGLDGTGTLLDTIALTANTSADRCDSSGLTYDCWTNIGAAFSGTAESVIFSGAANYIGFADITLGAASVPTATPEPSSLVLLGSGLVGLAGAVRRKLFA